MSDDIDIKGTNLVNELVDNFSEELMNTPDYTKRRAWHFGRVADILRRFDVVPTIMSDTKERGPMMSDEGQVHTDPMRCKACRR